MGAPSWRESSKVQPGGPGIRALGVSENEWRTIARDLAAGGGRLLGLWGDRDASGTSQIRAVLLSEHEALLLTLRLRDVDERYPGLEDLFPCASRLQRAVADLSGLHSTDPDLRPWLRHGAWPQLYRPLVDGAIAAPLDSQVDDYQFIRVEGDGVHEIPVGPVHAGIIEPGHFRISTVGEKVLKLEERLGYVHKGIEQRFTQLPIGEGHRLAARISGDSSVSYCWAYCQALEGISDVQITPRAAALRALCLEIERIANHLGDLGALGNDAGFAFGLAQFSRLKESLLRVTHDALGERYLMNAIAPGGTRVDLGAAGRVQLEACLREIAREALSLQRIYDEHAGLRDRFKGAGAVDAPLAARLGMIGLAGRASGQALDLRVDLPCEPYAKLAPVKCGRSEGDVAARVAVRFDELQESSRLIGRILAELPPGAHHVPVPLPPAEALGIGLIEGWRGPVLVALQAGEQGTIRRCHPHDPSWQNWPVIEHAIIGNIVPDFPLINKSFNLSYSGHDL